MLDHPTADDRSQADEMNTREKRLDMLKAFNRKNELDTMNRIDRISRASAMSPLIESSLDRFGVNHINILIIYNS